MWYENWKWRQFKKKKTNSVHSEQTVGRSLHMEMPSPPAVALPCATVFHSSWTYKHRCQLLIGHLLVSKHKWNTVVHGSTTARKEGISICKLLPTVCASVCHSSWMYKKQMICWSLKIRNWFDLIGWDFEQIHLILGLWQNTTTYKILLLALSKSKSWYFHHSYFPFFYALKTFILPWKFSMQMLRKQVFLKIGFLCSKQIKRGYNFFCHYCSITFLFCVV